jgi:hypothetical protein
MRSLLVGDPDFVESLMRLEGRTETYIHYPGQGIDNLMRPKIGVCINILAVSLMPQSFLHLPTLMVSACLGRI